MKVETERLENQTARLTVELEQAAWEQAKKKAARKISKSYTIKGFRKGKAPYREVVRNFGEQAIIEDAMEALGMEIYPKALQESELQPYTSGRIEDFQLDPPRYTFLVPLAPEVELGDYRSVRVDYEAPVITDDELESAMESLQQQEALVEESHQPIEMGNRLTVDVHSEFIDGDERPVPLEDLEDDEDDADEPVAEAEVVAEDAESESEVESADEDDAGEPVAEAEVVAEEDDEAGDDEDEVDDSIVYKGDPFIHRHDVVINLEPDAEEDPIFEGFTEAVIGANAEETIQFEAEIPDEEGYEDIVGRKVRFEVTIKKVESVTLPPLNDDFAARLTQDEDEPLTMLQLRIRIRENMQAETERQANNEYAEKILDEIVEQATISFPDEMVHERIHELIDDLAGRLREQGFDLDTYKALMNKTDEDLHEDYEPQAVTSVKRSLVLGEILQAEEVTVPATRIDEEIDAMLLQFGDQAAAFRQYLDTPQQRENIASSLLYQAVMDRLVKIGKGEPLDEPETDETDETDAAEDADTVAVAEGDEDTHETKTSLAATATPDAASETTVPDADQPADDKTEQS